MNNLTKIFIILLSILNLNVYSNLEIFLADSVKENDIKLAKKLLSESTKPWLISYVNNKIEVENFLNIALKNKNYDMCLLLLQNGASILLEDNQKETPLEIAKKLNSIKFTTLINLFLAYNYKKLIKGQNPTTFYTLQDILKEKPHSKL